MANSLILDASTAFSKIREALSAPGEARIAVAYWGRGAVEELGIKRRKGKTRIICDLLSGACNVEEMKELLKFAPDIEVRTLDGLHSKVYCGPNAVVLGSSNASPYGLGLLEPKVPARLEANVLISDEASVAASHQWFESVWNDSSLLPVTPALIADAEVLQRVRKTGIRLLGDTLLEGIRKNDVRLRKATIRAIAYYYDVDDEEWKEAKEVFDREARALYSKEELSSSPKKDTHRFYIDSTDWELQRGDYLIDYQAGRKSLKFTGVFQVRDDEHWQKQTSTGRIILVEERAGIEGFRFPSDERHELKKLCLKAISRTGWEAKGEDHYLLIDTPIRALLSKS